MKDNLILIGFMGAGKTSVGKKFAAENGLAFYDTDEMIVEAAGMPISQIFAEAGEESFRQMETELMEALLEEKAAGRGILCEGAVLSVGGGLPLREKNRKLLKRLGMVVWLKVSPDTVLERLSGDTTRPLLQGGNAREKVEKLQAQRGPLYEEASHHVVTADGKSVSQISGEIAELFEANLQQKVVEKAHIIV